MFSTKRSVYCHHGRNGFLMEERRRKKFTWTPTHVYNGKITILLGVFSPTKIFCSIYYISYDALLGGNRVERTDV
jgi:hypothetical protein